MRISVFSQILLIISAVFALALLAIGWFVSWSLAVWLALIAPVLFLVDQIARFINRIELFRRWKDKMLWHASSREIASRKQRESTERRRDRAKRILEKYENQSSSRTSASAREPGPTP